MFFCHSEFTHIHAASRAVSLLTNEKKTEYLAKFSCQSIKGLTYQDLFNSKQ